MPLKSRLATNHVFGRGHFDLVSARVWWRYVCWQHPCARETPSKDRRRVIVTRTDSTVLGHGRGGCCCGVVGTAELGLVTRGLRGFSDPCFVH